MGCGESKHDVATANTVKTSRKKPTATAPVRNASSDRINEDNKKKKNNKDTQAILEAGPIPAADRTAERKPETAKGVDPKQEAVAKDISSMHGHAAAMTSLKDVQGIVNISKEGSSPEGEKKGNDEENAAGEEENADEKVMNEEEEGRLIGRESPTGYFSSRRDEESFDGIEEPSSEKSVYFSPGHASKELEKSADNEEEDEEGGEAKAVTNTGGEVAEETKGENVVEEVAEVEKKISESSLSNDSANKNDEVNVTVASTAEAPQAQ